MALLKFGNKKVKLVTFL